MKRPRVLHLIHHLRIGGAETLLADLLPRLDETGFDIEVACLDDRGPLFDLLRTRGIPGHFLGRKRGVDPSAIWRLSRLLRSGRFAILNTHSFSAGFWGRIAAILARTPHVVTTVHTVAGWSQPMKQRLGNALLRPAADRIVAVSESVRRSLIAQGAPPGRTRVIHNGIRLERFRRSPDATADRRGLGLPTDGFLIGMIARCSREKGGDVGIRAVAKLVRSGLDVRGVWVGDGPEQAAWKEVAAAEGMSDRIRFVGMKPDVTPWLAVLDVLLCPSRQESFGLVALEGQASGVPVIATRVDGFLDVLHPGTDALLVPSDDPANLAEAVRALILVRSLSSALAAAGRLNATRFTIEHTAERYAALYHELLAG